MIPFPRRLLVILLLLLPPVAQGKDTALSLPALPAGYRTAEALVDLPRAGDAAAMMRLRIWSFHHCFGGARPKAGALEQPHAAQALWLALTTQALVLGQVPAAEALDQLDHLRQQRALGGEATDFFTTLWQDKMPSTQRAADFLRGWMAELAVPSLPGGEKAAIAAAIGAGCHALSCFEKNPPSAQSKSTR